jgi:ribosomal protein S18 acetylase RimI-like enzyme
MPAPLLRPFEAEDIPAAGALLAARHRSHRRDCPLLSARYEDEAAASAEVAAAFALPDASGTVAVSGGELVGYLLGAPKENPVWGPNVWVEAAGHAAIEAETLRDLYASASTRWVEEKRSAQYVLVPASDDALLNAWYRLGFGQQHAQAVRSLADVLPLASSTVVVRPAERRDLPALAQLEMVLPSHQGLAPTFSAGTTPSYEECLAGWEDDFGDPKYATFVAEVDGAVVGSSIGCSLDVTNSHAPLTRPDRAGYLGFAAVFPSARGHGAGRALGEAVIAWSAQSGYECVVTDWRVTNLLSSRAWPKLGFTESFLRLHRLIGY